MAVSLESVVSSCGWKEERGRFEGSGGNSKQVINDEIWITLSLHSMPSSRKNKVKKQLPPPALNQDDNNLVDDLLAQLESRDQAESTNLVNDLTISDKAASPAQKQDVKSRFKARQARKAALLAQSFSEDDPQQQARLEKEAKDEDNEIRKVCKDLSLEIYEISPDGHCLYSAVGDQLALLGILPQPQNNYVFIRTVAADFIRSHPDDFLPFLPSPESAGDDAGMLTPVQFEDYCSLIKDTATWGGEPEIVALSRAFKIPIHIVQGGKPPVVVHEPEDEGTNDNVNNVVRISYHRKLYGLGEHYNSLRPARGVS